MSSKFNISDFFNSDHNKIFEQYIGETIDGKFLLGLLNTDIKDFVGEVIKNNKVISLKPNDIPQYSNFKNCTDNLCFNLRYVNKDGLTFCEIGRLFLKGNQNDIALKKYGENAAKTGEILGLVTISKSSPRKVLLTNYGFIYNASDNWTRKELLARSILRAEYVKVLLIHANHSKVLTSDILNCISTKTYQRRIKNTELIMDTLFDYDDQIFKRFKENIIFDKVSD